jgi:hypothetical protein
MEQRAADGYLKVLSLVEQEALWLDSIVHNLGLDREDLDYGFVAYRQVPKPELTDRATAAALLAAFASEPVQASYAAWRVTAAALDARLETVCFARQEGDPNANTPEEWMKELTEDLQPKERAARQELAEAVATELGDRRQQQARRLSLRGRSTK